MKKLLSITLVLVLLAGVAAFAAEDRPLTGSWSNTLTLNPTQTQPFSAFASTLELTYDNGGITYNSTSTFTEDGFTDQTFGVSTSVGLLDLSSTLDFDPVDTDLDYWSTDANLTLGGVSISDYFLLQNTEDDGFGAGMDLAFNGETPGGVSVSVDNYFGMEPVTVDDGGDAIGDITGYNYGSGAAATSGYGIVLVHDDLDDQAYSPSSLQYVATKLSLDAMSLGCCDFGNETLFSEMNGFEYTKFDFTIGSSTLPLELSAELEFTTQTKSIVLTPSLSADWACFDVVTDLSGTLANNDETGSTIDGLEIVGFAIKDVNLGHVDFSSYTALGDYTVSDVGFGGDYASDYDEVFRVQKHEDLPLDFTLDVYFNMSNGGLFDLAYFDGEMGYALDDEFTLGTGIEVDSEEGLEKVELMLDYSF